MKHNYSFLQIIIPLVLTTPLWVQAGPPPEVPPTNIPSLAARVAELEALVAALTDKLACVSSSSDSTDLVFEGCNIHVHNGDGLTNSVNGLGNVIIGYNEDVTEPTPKVRTGSHNLIVGIDHTYSSSGGFVAGSTNSVTGQYSSVCGGSTNTASGYSSSVSGGVNHTASGVGSSVSGGVDNTASGILSSVNGGRSNIASGEDSSVSGGRWNTASGARSNVSGGNLNEAAYADSSILGGLNQTTTDVYQTVPALP